MGKYFTIKEMCSSNTARVKRIENVPNKEQEKNLEALIDNILDPLRETYGKPINVSSGFRSYHLNKAVGGAANSQHTLGQAADIYCTNKQDNKKLFDLIQSLNLPFDQVIWEKGNDSYPDWVHVSYSSRNRRQVLRIK